MPSNTPLPAAEFFSLWDDIARAIELDEMDWARSNVKRYRAARAASPRTLEEVLMMGVVEVPGAPEEKFWMPSDGGRKLFNHAYALKYKDDDDDNARRLAGEGGAK